MPGRGHGRAGRGHRRARVGGPPPAGPVRRSIWPAMHPRLLELVEAHRSTHHLRQRPPPGRAPRHPAQRAGRRRRATSRRRREADAAASARAPRADELVKAHHGSLSPRAAAASSRTSSSGASCKGLVATSLARARHRHGRGRPRHPGRVARRGVAAACSASAGPATRWASPAGASSSPSTAPTWSRRRSWSQRMHDGLIEHTRYPRNPLDVLAQQIVAMVRARRVGGRRPRRAWCGASANFAELSDEVLANVLDLLAGRYPSDEFAELRPRIVWDRVAGTVRGRAGAQRLAVTSGGTIPDRGLFGVFLPDGTRVGELDEEMVYESRAGETFLLGASTWRIEDITHERVVVTPAPGQPGKMPFWHGDGPGRPLELGRAVGAFVREIRGRCPRPRRSTGLRTATASTSSPPANLLALPRRAGRGHRRRARRPHDRGRALPRRDRRLAGLHPLAVRRPGARAVGHGPAGPAGRAVGHRRRAACGATTASCCACPRPSTSCPLDELLIDPDEIDEHRRRRSCPTRRCSPSRFRECAARALLLPRRRPDRRTPLWQQRQRAADLLAVAASYPTSRSCSRPPASASTTCSTCRRCARCSPTCGRRQVRVVAGRHAAGVAVRPVAAVRLDRGLHVRGRRAAGRAAGRGAGARPRPAARPARRRGAARAARPGGARPTSSSSCSAWPTAAGPATPTRSTTCCALLGPLVALASSRPAPTRPTPRPRRRGRGSTQLVGRAPGHRRRPWPARSASPPPRTPPACATRSASPCPSGCRRPSPTRSTTRSPTWSPASPAPTVRSSPRQVAAALGVGARAGAAGARAARGRRAGWCGASSGPTARARVVRRRRAAPAPAPVAGRAAAARSSRSRPTALARFLPRVAGRRRRPAAASTPLVEALGVLQGAAVPASVLEADVLAARVARLPPGRPRRAVHRGRGGVGRAPAPLGAPRRPGAPAVPRPGRRCCVAPRRVDEAADRPVPVAEPVAATRCSAPTCADRRGASFWPDLVGRRRRPPASPTTTPPCSPRCGTWCGRARSPTTRSRRCARSWRRAGGARPRPGAVGAPLAAGRAPSAGAPTSAGPQLGSVLAASGPPAAAGRWSLVAPAARAPADGHRGGPRPALQLLERHGVLTREAALAEGVEGGFAGVYPVLKALEERGQVRRGYFVAGLGAAQFALPGAVDRLRAAREVGADAERQPPRRPRTVVLAATDPAQPYGAALPWPESAGRPARGPPAPSWCWSAASPSPTSSAAAGRSSCSPRPSTTRLGRRPRRHRRPAGGSAPPARDRPHRRRAGRRRRPTPTRCAPPASPTATGASSSAGAERRAGDTVPEGDTIHRTAARLRPALVGRPLVRFEAPRRLARGPSRARSSPVSRHGASTCSSTSTTAGPCRPTCA